MTVRSGSREVPGPRAELGFAQPPVEVRLTERADRQGEILFGRPSVLTLVARSPDLAPAGPSNRVVFVFEPKQPALLTPWQKHRQTDVLITWPQFLAGSLLQPEERHRM